MEDIIETLVANGMNLIAAALILIIGLWVAKKVRGFLRTHFTKREIEPMLVVFFSNLVYGALAVFVVIAAISKVGIQTTSFVAVLGAAGLAVGLALQGSLSNFASGVLIIIFKPFKLGDFIDAGGTAGTVLETGILFTEMKTPDNRKIIMPNSQLMSGSIINITANPTRRVDMVIGVSYSDDLDKVRQILLDELEADERVLKDPAPQVVVGALGDSSIDFFVRPWAKKEDYWPFYFDFHKRIKQKFDKEGVSIPFPQRDVHLFQQASKKDLA